MTHVKDRTGDDSFFWVLGGTHLGFYDRQHLNDIIGELKGFNVEHLGISHCTGLEAGAQLLQEMGERVQFCSVGTIRGA
jgi:7,8-dihydropterin-6-yl-methyl-4-(beta-D-ribofuranosyl)aminobenzene 5'-phosphate synthase